MKYCSEQGEKNHGNSKNTNVEKKSSSLVKCQNEDIDSWGCEEACHH
jgi:hypothetical protein